MVARRTKQTKQLRKLVIYFDQDDGVFFAHAGGNPDFGEYEFHGMGSSPFEALIELVADLRIAQVNRIESLDQWNVLS